MSGALAIPCKMRMRLAMCLGGCLLATAIGCNRQTHEFGRVRKPAARRLVFENGGEPVSLDPHLMGTTGDLNIADALYSSLVRLHPVTLEPTADIATHYERNAEATRYTFYLRGHPDPRGTRLLNTNNLREQFRTGKIPEDLARGHIAPPDSIPARWSDGLPLTAHDFVYSWRRLFDPKTASPFASSYAYIRNSAEVLAGKRPLAELGVSAIDDWTLEVQLAQPTDYFLELLDTFTFFAVPRQAIEPANARGAPHSWTDVRSIVTSGAFRLAEWHPYEKLIVRKSPTYWEAGLVGLDEIVFLPIEDALTNLNLYKAGDADVLMGVNPAFVPALRRTHDYRSAQTLAVDFLQCNTRNAPLDNPLVRYALNMSVDKQRLVKLYNGNQTPARTLIPPIGYEPPAAVPVEVKRHTYDVSRYNPAAARELMAMAGLPGGRPLRLDLIYTNTSAIAAQIVEVLRQQWSDNLGIELAATKLESAAFFDATEKGHYQGLAMNGWINFPPVLFLDPFLSGSEASGMFWRPPEFVALANETKLTVGREARMRKLAECDRMVMQGMPLIPLYFNRMDSLFKPYVRNLRLNAAFEFRFKYAFVETG